LRSSRLWSVTGSAAQGKKEGVREAWKVEGACKEGKKSESILF
jgi:hypothetical protein